MTEQSLKSLDLGKTGKILRLSARGDTERRLLDLGFTAGTKVCCLLDSPSGGIRAYQVRGAVIALRSTDAETIKIKEEGYVLV